MFLSPLNTKDGLYLSNKVIVHLVWEIIIVLVAPIKTTVNIRGTCVSMLTKLRCYLLARKDKNKNQK